MPTSTFARSTRKHTLARAEGFSVRISWSRFLQGTALLVASLAALVACDGGDEGAIAPTATVTDPSQPTPTVQPEPALADRIGVRADLPTNDPIDLAARYGLTEGRAAQAKPFAGEANVGDTRDFFVQRISAAAYSGDEPPENAVITARLLAKSEHAYFYVDEAIGANEGDAEAAAAAFEDRVWPAITQVFGTPATPGVDGDPRIIVLQADLGSAVGGYYSPDDSFLRSVRPQSNEAEMVYLDQTLDMGGASFSVVLAHELQHLVHARLDHDEEAWVNEGLAEAASGLVGGAVSSVEAFAARPSIQLNTWTSEGSSAHYGAAAAFNRYLAHRFGGDVALGGIARVSEDGTAGIERFLSATDEKLSFTDAFADWVTANALDMSEGPYANPGGPIDVQVEDTLNAGTSIADEATQFGTHYYLLDGLEAAPHTLRFDGAADVDVLPVSTPDGSAVLWSNAQDDIDTMLTRELDLSGADAPVLTFQTWFDIEPWYDWGYVSVSTDGGSSWRALEGTHVTTEDPVAVAYGPGYTGASGGGDVAQWVDERISLQEFAGRRILLRFEYVTDGSTHGEGWAIDNVSVEDASFTDNAGSDDGWDFDGWVRIDQALEQAWVVRLIATGPEGEPVVVDAQIAPDGSASIDFDGTGLRDAVVAIAGATEGTRQLAPYTIELTRQ